MNDVDYFYENSIDDVDTQRSDENENELYTDIFNEVSEDDKEGKVPNRNMSPFVCLHNYMGVDEEVNVDGQENEDADQYNHVGEEDTDTAENMNIGIAIMTAEDAPDHKSKRGSYRTYSDKQIADFINLVNTQGYSRRRAAIELGINPRTATDYYKQYLEEETRTREPRKAMIRGRKPILTTVHTEFLLNYVEKKPTAILEDIMEDLCVAFNGLKIGKTTLHNHLKDKCGLTLKKLEKHKAARNSESSRIKSRANP